MDIIEVKYLENYSLELTFENREKGVVNLKDYRNRGGVFRQFADLDYFKKVFVNKEIGTICWPDGIDIAPETLYRLIQEAKPASS